MSKIKIVMAGHKIDSEEVAEELRRLLAEYDESKKQPKRFVPDVGERYTFVNASGYPATFSNDRDDFDNVVITMGNCFPVDSGLAEKAAPMIADCIKAIHCAVMNNIEADMAAAELMGYRYDVNPFDTCLIVDDRSESGLKGKPFSLNNKSDRVDFVEFIGEAHGISICCNGGDEQGNMLWGYGHPSLGMKEWLTTHTEACQEAAIYLRGEK